MGNNELMHYGVLGMKWGHRKGNYSKRTLRGNAGPGRYTTRERQLAGDMKDLDGLSKGQHLSRGFTKKRQAAFDARDKKLLEQRIAKSTHKLADKQEKKNMKEDVKNRRLLSEADIKKKIERIKMQQQLKNITEEEISPGKKFVSDIVSSSGKKAVTAIVTGAMLYSVKTAMTREFNIKEAASYMTPKPKNK